MKFVKNLLPTVLLMAILSVTNSGCETLFGDDEDPTQSIDVYLDKSDVSPFEQVTITAIAYDFPQESYMATIGGKDITLTRTTSNQLVFTMPFIAGNQVLVVVLNEVSYSFDFMVNELEPIANPDELISTYQQSVAGVIAEVEQMIQQGELQISVEHMQVLKNQKSTFDQSFASATTDQKRTGMPGQSAKIAGAFPIVQ